METITSTELRDKIGVYASKALAEPVSISRHGREALVLLSAGEYERLKRRDRAVLRAVLRAGRDPEFAEGLQASLHELDNQAAETH